MKNKNCLMVTNSYISIFVYIIVTNLLTGCGYFNKDKTPVDNRPEALKQADDVPPEMWAWLKNLTPEQRQSLKDTTPEQMKGLERLQKLPKEDLKALESLSSEQIATLKKLQAMPPDQLKLLESLSSEDIEGLKKLRQLPKEDLEMLKQLTPEDIAQFKKLKQIPKEDIDFLASMDPSLLEGLKKLRQLPKEDLETITRLTPLEMEVLKNQIKSYREDQKPLSETEKQKMQQQVELCMEKDHQLYALLDPKEIEPKQIISRLKNLDLYWAREGWTQWFRHWTIVLHRRLVLSMLFQSNVWVLDRNKTSSQVRFRLVAIDPKTCGITHSNQTLLTGGSEFQERTLLEWAAIPRNQKMISDLSKMDPTRINSIPREIFDFDFGFFDTETYQRTKEIRLRKILATKNLELPLLDK